MLLAVLPALKLALLLFALLLAVLPALKLALLLSALLLPAPLLALVVLDGPTLDLNVLLNA